MMMNARKYAEGEITGARLLYIVLVLSYILSNATNHSNGPRKSHFFPDSLHLLLLVEWYIIGCKMDPSIKPMDPSIRCRFDSDFSTLNK